MDSLVLSLQCGKATAVFVPTANRDTVAEAWKCGSRGLDIIFTCGIQVKLHCCTSRYEHEWCVCVCVCVFFFFVFRVCAARNKHIITHLSRSFCRLFVICWGALRTQTGCGSCTVYPKVHHRTKRSLAVCKHNEEVLSYFVVVFHSDICREDSLVGQAAQLPHD